MLSDEKLGTYEAGLKKHISPRGCSVLIQRDDLIELLRGYRALMREIEHHEGELVRANTKASEWEKKKNSPLVFEYKKRAAYHADRLAALKGEKG